VNIFKIVDELEIVPIAMPPNYAPTLSKTCTSLNTINFSTKLEKKKNYIPRKFHKDLEKNSFKLSEISTIKNSSINIKKEDFFVTNSVSHYK
jgi:hypothetical protein